MEGGEGGEKEKWRSVTHGGGSGLLFRTSIFKPWMLLDSWKRRCRVCSMALNSSAEIPRALGFSIVTCYRRDDWQARCASSIVGSGRPSNVEVVMFSRNRGRGAGSHVLVSFNCRKPKNPEKLRYLSTRSGRDLTRLRRRGRRGVSWFGVLEVKLRCGPKKLRPRRRRDILENRLGKNKWGHLRGVAAGATRGHAGGSSAV